MKSISKLFVLISILSWVFINNSCTKDNNPFKARLQVFVKQDSETGACIGHVQVKLYSSALNRDIDNSEAIAYTDSLNPSSIGANFENLSAQRYYLKASYRIGPDEYEGTSDVLLQLNKTTNCDIITEKTTASGDGNLKVFVRYYNTYFGGAVVKLYLSDADRTANNVFQQANTTDHGGGPGDQYAIFYSLPYAKYYIKATYDDIGKYYVGYEDNKSGVWVPSGLTVVNIMTDY